LLAAENALKRKRGPGFEKRAFQSSKPNKITRSFYDSVLFWTAAVCFSVTQPSCSLPHLLQLTGTLSLMSPYFSRYSSGVILPIRPHPHSGHSDLIWYLSFAMFYLLRIVSSIVPVTGPFLPGFDTYSVFHRPPAQRTLTNPIELIELME
jgi:hypothetical protein